jgi:hypothetical protein
MMRKCLTDTQLTKEPGLVPGFFAPNESRTMEFAPHCPGKQGLSVGAENKNNGNCTWMQN